MCPKVEVYLPALPKQVGEEPERHVWCPYSLDFQMKMGRALLGLLHPFLPHPHIPLDVWCRLAAHRKLCGGVARAGSEQGAAGGMGDLGEDGAGSSCIQHSSEAPPLQVSISMRKLWQGHSSLNTAAGPVGEGCMGESPSWGSSEQLILVNVSRALALRGEQCIADLSLFCFSLILAIKDICFFSI